MNSSFSLHVNSGAERLHHADGRDLVKRQSLMVLQCLPGIFGCTPPAPEPHAEMMLCCDVLWYVLQWEKSQYCCFAVKLDGGRYLLYLSSRLVVRC
jgi:hypothetical protein